MRRPEDEDARKVEAPRGPHVSMGRALIPTLNVVIPFALAAVVTLTIRGWQVDRAALEISELRQNIRTQSSDQTIDAVTGKLVKALYGEPIADKKLLEAREQYAELIRALAFTNQESTPGFCTRDGRNPILYFLWWLVAPSQDGATLVHCHIFDTMLIAGMIDRGVQLGILFFFPALFTILFFHARGEMNRLGAKLEKGSASRMERIEYRRFEHILCKGAGAAFSRFGFAAMVALATLYVLAPRGIKASIIGDYIMLHVPPGTASCPDWFRSFEFAPPYVCGIVGFLLYAMVSCLQRYSMGAISSRLYTSLFNRGLVVMLISLVMTSISDGEDKLTRALCFLVGMFPQAGLQLASKLSQATADRFSLESSSGFRELMEIDLWKEAALREWGITNIHDLAHADISQLILDVGIQPAILLEAVDKAILIDTFGAERAARLGVLSVFSATDLMHYTQDKEGQRREEAVARAAEALQVRDIAVQLDKLQQNQNVRFLLHGYAPPAAA